MTDSNSDRLARLMREQRNALFGKYRGKVTKVGTKDDLGLIKATVPSVFGSDLESPWIEPAVAFAGKKHGFAFLPEVGDGVWIEFEAGQIARPLWTGFFWAKDQIPDGVTDKVRVLASSHGHQLVIDDDKDELRIVHGNGPSIVLTKDSITIKVSSKSIVLDQNGLNVNDRALEVS